MLAARVADAIRRHAIFKPGDRVLVAVSGGPDSLALLSVLREIVPTIPLALVVAHFDHGWRGESADDARFVAGLAERWGYPWALGQADASLARTEDAARTARYRFLRETARASGCSLIALGHTQDDQVETLLLHLLRGSGARGLGAMRARSDDLARPLLGISRQEIETYLHLRQLTPVRDPSNQDVRFARNRVRRDLLPALDRFSPASRRLLARTAEILADEDRLLDQEAASLPADVARDRAAFLALPVALQRRLLRRLHPGLGYVPLEALRHEGLPGGAPRPTVGVARVTATACRCDPATFKARGGVAHVDAATLAPPLEVCPRRPGDRVQPLGFAHEKKLQDILVDAHVPRHLRDTLPIVRDQRGIVWIPGVTVAHSRRVTPQTREQWHLEIKPD